METIPRKHWTALNALAAKGDPDAQCELGYLYEVGAKHKAGKIVVTPSLTAAMTWYQASADQGNPSAQSALSTALSSGGEIECNFPLATYWGNKAVAQGDASAAFNVGTIYRDMGEPRLAFRWYQRAADMGDTDAFLQIGLSYFFGVGTKQDYGSALSSIERVVADEAGT